nr:hypothetical protein [Tanacetum cinerariifolium]
MEEVLLVEIPEFYHFVQRKFLEDPRSRLEGVFPYNISRTLHGVKLLGGLASVDFDFSSEIVMKRVAKTIELMDVVSWINDPQYSGPTFDDTLRVFNTSMETGILSNPSEIDAPKLIKKMAVIYFTRVNNTVESAFSLSFRQVALWKSQMEDHTSDWLRAVLISGLRQTMNGKTYRCVLCYRLGVLLFSFWKPWLACSQVFAGNIYEGHVVSCAGIIGIKHRHNIVRDTIVDICYRSGISAGKEIDIGLEGRHDKPLRLEDMILYSWDGGLDVCVDLTGSSPLKQTGIADFASSRAVIDAAYNVNVSSMRLKEDDIEPGVVLGRSFLRLTKVIANFMTETVTIYPRLDPFLISFDDEEKIDDCW